MNPIYKFEINRPTVNLLNPKTVVFGLLDTSTGNISSSSVYQTSDFIPVTPGTNYKLCDADTFTAWAASAACFYTENKTFISGQYGIGETPANAAYLRVSYQGLNNGYGIFQSTTASYSAYVSPIAYPIYKDDLAKDFELQSNQQFFRAKLSGKLTFVGDDYEYIVGRPFDFQFLVTLFISYNAGQSWTKYWTGTFWKTDCDFDGDAKTVQVTPTVNDQYNDVLAGMEKEYNLIDLLPEIVPVKLDKRPMIQVYVPGQKVVGCFLSGMWWEQECESVLESDTVEIEGHNYPALTYKYHFALNTTLAIVEVSGNMSPQLPNMFTKRYTGDDRFNPATQGTTEMAGTDYTFSYFFYAGGGGATQKWQIIRNSDSTVMWEKSWSGGTLPDTSLPQTVVLTPVSGTGATGNVTLYVHEKPVYARYILDVDTILGLNTYELPTDDLVENNRNYRRAIGYAVSDVIYFSSRLTSTPTQWGIYQPGQYYQQPYLYWSPELFPIARAGWDNISTWFSFSAFDWLAEESGRAPYTLKDSFPLSSVISVLLGKIAPGLTHDKTTDYSQFLYGPNPFTGVEQTLLITPKSNIISAGYDQPAQKAPITLKRVMDMLRDCFRCYWFVDSQGRFRIEHIRYFMLGGTYSGTPVVGTDLTAQKVTRNGKAWAFARNQFKFDKPEMAARYQFGWMDDVTQLFEGFPIDIISKYVNPDNIEEISVSQFTSDIDYILLNPGEISKDGFVLMAAKPYNVLNSAISVVTGSNGYAKLVDYDISNGNKIKIRVSVNTGYARIYFYTSGGSGISSGQLFSANAGIVEQELTVPDNVGYIGVVSTVAGATVTLYDILPGIFVLPYINFNIDNTDHILQNAYVAFAYLQRYYSYDMPAYQYAINGVTQYAIGIKKLKTQSLKFPMLNDPDLVKLIKTNIGNGMIQKLSVNLSSRNANATLKYDTE